MTQEETTTAVDMSAQDFLALGDACFVEESYHAAIDAYASGFAVLRDDEDGLVRFRLLSHRSGALFQLGRYEEALTDAHDATELVNNNGTSISGLRSGETETCLRREGIAAFRLGRYQEAKDVLEKALQLATLNQNKDVITLYQDYIRQCGEKLAPPPPKKPAASSPAPVVVSSSATPPNTPATPANLPSSSSSTVTPAASTNKKGRPVTPKYQYYQSDKMMTVTILEPNVKAENLKVTFETKRLTAVLHKQGFDLTIVAGTLYEEVDAENCKIKIKDEKVFLKLPKLKHHEWPELLGKQPMIAPAPEIKPDLEDASSVPIVNEKNRPYVSTRDWNAIEKNVLADEASEKPEGDEAANHLFRQIYKNADDDTKRAMIKSYQTSGGTVLSTNWSEVKKTDYEEKRTAPKGMEWKTWEGKKLPMDDDDE